MQFYLGTLFESKRQALEHLLEFGMVMVHLDARCPSVKVPVRLKNQEHLKLNLSLRFNISDFKITDEGAEASLSFGGQRSFCLLSFEGIFALSSHVEPLFYLWPEDVPPELEQNFERLPLITEGPNPADPVPEPIPEGRVTAFRVIEGGEPEPEPEETPEEVEEAPEEVVEAPEPVAEATEEPPEAPEEPEDDPPSPPSNAGRRYGHLKVVK